MPFSAKDVPPGPYFHGTRATLYTGTVLRAGVVHPGVDPREMVWATTDVADALLWAGRGLTPRGTALYVYEVTLTDPEVDTNATKEWETPPFRRVMAPHGVVLGLVQRAFAK